MPVPSANADTHCAHGRRVTRKAIAGAGRVHKGVRQDLHVAAQASKVALHVALPATPRRMGRKTAAVGHAVLADTLSGGGAI